MFNFHVENQRGPSNSREPENKENVRNESGTGEQIGKCDKIENQKFDVVFFLIISKPLAGPVKRCYKW